jgi:hypothetical protein
MPCETVIAENEKPFEKLRLAIIGPEKSGKSRLAATAPKPVLVIDRDGRRASLAGRSGVYVKTYSEIPETVNANLQPQSWQEILDLHTQLEKSLSLRTLGFDVPEDLMVATIVNDSIQTIAKAAMSYITYNTAGLRRDVVVGPGRTYRSPKGWDAWGSEVNEIEQMLMRQFAIKGLHSISIFHETAEKAPDSTEENPRFTGRKSIYPPRYISLLKYFNEVWRVTREPGVPEPLVTTVPTYEFSPGTTTMLLDSVERPDIELLIKKHEYNSLNPKK